jgi:hypothetical protein
MNGSSQFQAPGPKLLEVEDELLLELLWPRGLKLTRDLKLEQLLEDEEEEEEEDDILKNFVQ